MQNYLRWLQVNSSSGKITCGCRQNFPQVTSRNLQVLAVNLGETSIVWVRMDSLKFFLSSTKQLGQSKALLSLKWMINPWKMILFTTRWTVHWWLFNALSKKDSSQEIFSFFRLLAQDLGWYFRVLWCDGNVCNWTPKLNWPRRG